MARFDLTLGAIGGISGAIGAIFFAICAFPQVYQVWKTQDTKSISLLFLIFWTIGEIFMWTYVGIDNYQNHTFQWPLHLNYLLNAISLGYLDYKKIKDVRYEKQQTNDMGHK